MDPIPPILSDNAVVGLMALLITTLAALWRNSRDQRQALTLMKLQHEMDTEKRNATARENAAEREAHALALKTQIAHDAETARLRLELAALQRATGRIGWD